MGKLFHCSGSNPICRKREAAYHPWFLVRDRMRLFVLYLGSVPIQQ